MPGLTFFFFFFLIFFGFLLLLYFSWLLFERVLEQRTSCLSYSYVFFKFFSLFTKHISKHIQIYKCIYNNKNIQRQVAQHLTGNLWSTLPHSHSTRVGFLFPQNTRPFIASGGRIQWPLLIHNGHGLWTYLQSKVPVFRWTQTHSSHTWLWSTALSAAWRQESSHS